MRPRGAGFLALAAALALAPRGAFAQAAVPAKAGGDPLASLASYRLGAEDGLPGNSVFCMTQDRRGFLWVGTFSGLSRYDGDSFTNYRPRPGSGSLASSLIFAVLEDSRGTIWVGTDGGGLSRYDPSGDLFSTFRAGGPGGLNSDRILALAEDGEGGLWIACGDGSLQRLPPGGGPFATLLPAGGAPTRVLLAGSSGSVWAGTEGDGLIRFGPEGAEEERFNHHPGNPRSIPSDVVRSLLEDSAGRLLVGGGGGEVARLEGGAFRRAAVRGGKAPRDAVRALAEDGAGRIWVGYADSGLAFLEPEAFVIEPPAPGSAAMVRALLRDSGGLVWAGYKDGGLRAFSPGSAAFSRYRSLADGRPLAAARGLAEAPDGSLVVCTDGTGPLRLDPRDGSLRPEPGFEGLAEARKAYAALFARDGSLWIGTDGSGILVREPGGRIRSFRKGQGPAGLSSDVIWTLHEDRHGRIWVGTEGGGLARWDPATGGFVRYPADEGPGSIRGSSVRAILVDSRDRLWVGTWDGGLSRLEPGAAAFKAWAPDPAEPGSIGDASVNCLFEDSSGAIWVGTGGGGLARLDEDGKAYLRVGEEEGLAGDAVLGVLEDFDGALWIATGAGLSRYDPASGAFFNYGAEDGLASGELSQNSYLRARDGRLWFGGPEGLTGFDPRSAPRRRTPPEVLLSGLELPATRRSPARRLAALETLELDHDNAGLRFSVAVTDYSAPSRNRYAMRLEGPGLSGGGAWSSLGRHNDGFIAPLAPGSYVLHARGANGNGVWDEEGTSLSIRVRPPFWATAWFRLLVAGLVGLGLGLGLRARVRALQRRAALLRNFSRHVEAAREEERKDAAREVHDEIGQHLAALKLQAHWLATHPAVPEELRKERFAEMLGSLGEAMAAVKSVITGLRPMALDNLPLGEAVGWYLGEFRRRTGIEAEASIAGDLPPVPGEISTALFRVLQEMLSNVARHSGASRVLVSLRMEGGSLVLSSSDDGGGIPAGAEEADDAFGFIGMRERCAALGGSLAVLRGAGPGEGGLPGALVRVSVPLPAPAAQAAAAAEASQGGQGC